jgi:hypothetical protein
VWCTRQPVWCARAPRTLALSLAFSLPPSCAPPPPPNGNCRPRATTPPQTLPPPPPPPPPPPHDRSAITTCRRRHPSLTHSIPPGLVPIRHGWCIVPVHHPFFLPPPQLSPSPFPPSPTLTFPVPSPTTLPLPSPFPAPPSSLLVLPLGEALPPLACIERSTLPSVYEGDQLGPSHVPRIERHTLPARVGARGGAGGVGRDPEIPRSSGGLYIVT